VVLGVALLAGAGEEVFFRLALPRLLTGRLRWLVPIALYAAATVATGNVGLVIVAVPLGASCMAVWERTGRWSAPLIVHALWSVAMVGVLPLLIG
ncbi:CPBP family glutamic-type intramembrane protease, partial [Brachybacterium nesterenkovii]|uniref:CPBP family glutamic-type intramembrane protease n=1 Tax=Brachybacterium nesterenkovii TaxID=47847 RepID=UPI00321BE7E6